jgi:hypothetical protein
MENSLTEQLKDLLRTAQRPLSFEEIYSLYKDQYPFNTADRRKVRYLLMRSSGIIMVNALYTLREAVNAFDGTLIQLIRNIVAQAKETSLTTRQIIDKLRFIYPDTSVRSVQETIYKHKTIFNVEGHGKYSIKNL